MVTSDGALVAAKSKGIVNVTHPSTGAYCVHVDPSIDTHTVEAVVSPDFSGTQPATVGYIRSSDVDCHAIPNVIDVRFARVVAAAAGSADSETPVSAPFFLMVP